MPKRFMQQREFHLEFMEIADIPRHHRQPMNASRGGDHRILEQRIRLPVLEARPFPKSRHVHRQDTVAVDDPTEPGFQFRRFRRVLLARPLDTGLNFSGRDGGQEQPVGGNRLDPVQHRLVRSGTAKFRNNVGI